MNFDRYGVRQADLHEAARHVSGALACRFVLREDPFWGEYYLAHSDDWREQIRLKENFHSDTNQWNAPTYREYPLVLEVSGATDERASAIQHKLSQAQFLGAVLLQHRVHA
jgi:hypothetical protein